MDWLHYAVIVLIAGLVGTSCMTLFVLAIHALINQPLHVIRILGTMLTNSTGENGHVSMSRHALMVGTVCHYIVGFIFTAAYVYCWTNQLLSADTATSALVGFLTGIFAIVVWRFFFALHRQPPMVPLTIYLGCILVAHVIFAITVAWTYNLLSS